jgi:DNA-binding MurR/RpiR family transcriptional regulator
MRSAVRAGAKVVFVTDQVGRASPDHASVTLRCRTRGAGVFDSMTPAVSLLTYLCSALATRLGESAIDRLKTIDSIHEEWGDLIATEL